MEYAKKRSEARRREIDYLLALDHERRMRRLDQPPPGESAKAAIIQTWDSPQSGQNVISDKR
jgi:hypothetical protein